MCKICGFKTEKREINNITYHVCRNCDFLFKDDAHLLSKELEFNRYKQHNNNDENYFNYLSNVYDGISSYVCGRVLDYGCGDNHFLANIVSNNGYICDYYDLYFYPDENYLNNKYHTIILSEVIEHLSNPLSELEKLVSILEKDGHLIIKTNLLNENINLNSWWYLRDSTHVCFYSYKTFLKVCELFSLEIIYCNDKDLIILKKV